MRCRIGTARRALLRRYCLGALRSVQVGVRFGSVGFRTARLNPQKLWITKWISPYKVRSTSLASGLRSDCSKIAQPAPAFPVVSARYAQQQRRRPALMRRFRLRPPGLHTRGSACLRARDPEQALAALFAGGRAQSKGSAVQRSGLGRGRPLGRRYSGPAN